MTNSVEQYDEHVDVNPSANPTFDAVLEIRLSRRALLRGSAGMFAGTLLGTALTACGNDSYTPAAVPAPKLSLNFASVAKSTADTLTVPAGYTATVLFRLGDPMSASTAEYRNDGTDDPASFAQRCGDHNDALHYFGLGAGGWLPSGSDRGLLVQNHEAITPLFLHPKGPTIVNNVRTVPGEVVKEQNAHGVSVIEVAKMGNTVSYVRNSTYNRRITTMTDMILSGPAGGTAAMVTAYSTDGTRTRGTVNNCAHGYTRGERTSPARRTGPATSGARPPPTIRTAPRRN
jgi:secreted PhoX family phosphatase